MIFLKYQNVALDMNTVIPILNKKMKAVNCPLTIDGVGEVDNTISFYQNMIKLLKKTIFTFINNMGVGIRKTYPDLSSGAAPSCGVDNLLPNDPSVGICKAKMIPLQKWVNVIVSVYSQVVDIYIDGQLTSSCILKGFPNISTDPIRNIDPKEIMFTKSTTKAFNERLQGEAPNVPDIKQHVRDIEQIYYIF